MNILVIIPGMFPLRRFIVEVGPYKKTYQTCAKFERSTTKNIDFKCRNGSKGRSVKITLRQRGFLTLCQVAVYAKHG